MQIFTFFALNSIPHHKAQSRAKWRSAGRSRQVDTRALPMVYAPKAVHDHLGQYNF